MEFVSSNELRAQFAASLSAMYQSEKGACIYFDGKAANDVLMCRVPLYGELLKIVADVNEKDPSLSSLSSAEKARLRAERHGAIRLGSPAELQVSLLRTHLLDHQQTKRKYRYVCLTI